MALEPGNRVQHPDDGRQGTVITIDATPACLSRWVRVRWDDGREEELEELDFGPLTDERS